MVDLLYWLISNLIRTFFCKNWRGKKSYNFLSKFNFVTVSDKDICWHITTSSEHNQWKLKKKEKKTHQNWMKYKNSIYLSYMWNFRIWPLLDPFLNKIATYFFSFFLYCKSITHKDDHFVTTKNYIKIGWKILEIGQLQLSLSWKLL